MALEEIVRRKRSAVAQRKRDVPLESFRAALTPSKRNFEAALRRPHTGFILECKKASPSQGLIRNDFDPRAIATAYAGFADAISVVTDEPFFQGSHAFLPLVEEGSGRETPLLCKDFVVDPYQIYEARHFGADAVLLMCSVLTEQDDLVNCLRLTKELGLDALVEVQDEAELARAIDADATIIGINNRNLATLQIDLATTRRLAPLVPEGRVAICESGIHNHRDIVELRGLVDAFLIGTSLMRQPDLARAVRELVYGRVKICGLTRRDDALCAKTSGAVFGGLVLWPRSPRSVTVEQALAVRKDVDLAWVGVFVDETPRRVADAAARLDLAAVQLHGSESPELVAEVRQLVACPVWKAVRAREGTAIPGRAHTNADRLLVDAYKRGVPGGTGESFDWDRIRHDCHELVLSGGLHASNAAEADALACWALDLSSGVEQQPGVKSPEKIGAFFSALRGSTAS